MKYNLTLGCSELLEAGSTSDRGIAFLSESYGLGLAPELWSGPPTVDGGSGLAPSGRVLSSPTVARSIHIPCSHSSSLHPGLLVCNVCHLDVAWTWLRCGAEITT